jgi:DNA invertase Pin-like site-specific DNA recombinase
METRHLAVAYLRCSSDASIFGDTWNRQLTAIRDYAQAHHIEIVGEYRDEGIPGKTELENRPGLAACLERVENNGVKIVLIEIADRLARDLVVAEVIIRQFQKARCRVISASGGVDLTAGDDSNPTAKLIRQILACVAEFDRCVTVLKLRAARQRQKTKNGKCEGRKSYGSRPGEQRILSLILSYQQQFTTEGIAQMLNAFGHPTRYGKRWHSGTVSKILARQQLR